MSTRSLRELVLSAMHGSLITGLAAAGCGDPVAPPRPDAGAADGGQQTPPPKGGTGGTGGVGGRDVALPANCFRNPVGTCCRDLVCVDPPSSSGALDDAGSDTADAGGSAMCPERSPMQSNTCDNYGRLQSVEDGQCCYVRTHGTCCGRPFLDAGRMLGAKEQSRRDWLQAQVYPETSIEAMTRAALARAWQMDATTEHASIASFARFTLQLLSLGAPADLVADVQRAALDEVGHAQACYELASRYAGRALGPGELPMPRQLTVVPLAQAAAEAVHEGCVAETIAAQQAHEQLQHALDPQVRAALQVIAADEARHAALAYRFVRWAVEIGGAEVTEAVHAAFARARLQLMADVLQPQADQDGLQWTVWREHGRLTADEQRAAALACWHEVIEPCAGALLRGQT